MVDPLLIDQNIGADFWATFSFFRHHVHGIHVLEESGEKPDLAKIYFPDAHPDWDVYTADVKASVIEQNCQALVMNPDFEEKDLYWTYIDRDNT